MTDEPGTTPVLGIDIGGSGIKGGLVDLDRGELIGERYRIETPNPSTPPAVAKVVAEVVSHFSYEGPVGVDFPAVVKSGVARTAANVDASWIGTDIAATMSAQLSCSVYALNDADAAGLDPCRPGQVAEVEPASEDVPDDLDSGHDKAPAGDG